METKEYYGGTYPEPDWCYKDDEEEFKEDAEEYYADEYYELKELEMI